MSPVTSTPGAPPPLPAYRLVRRPAAPVGAPALDPAQRRVVGHAGGPLLVLAGPGTGKTTTLVEAVVARIDAGADPERVLVLTFSRKAAAELRQRVTSRLGRTVREPLARTFHSFAFGVLRREATLRGEPPPRLLSGPEQDLVVRELLRGEVGGDGAPSGWPPELRAALTTRGFAQELRDLLLRATERGLDARDLDRLGREHRRADWRAAARFWRQYAAVGALAEAAAYDPSELIRAVLDRGLAAAERGSYDWVFVDEYQDTDPSQEALLGELVPPGGNLVAVGDPHQSIYAFRGADVRCIQRFPQRFARRDGSLAPVEHLTTCRRSAPRVLAVGQAVAARLRTRVPVGGPGGPAPGPARLVGLPDRAPGAVDVLVAGSAAQEAALVAGVLRRAHVLDGLPWSGMAVLVRSTRGRLPVLRRALLAAGVPVAVPGEELPLGDQPGLRPLLDVLRAAVRPDTLDDLTAEALLTGPVGGLDAMGLRRLRRELRHVELAAGGSRRSGELLAEAVREPAALAMVADRVRRPAERVAALLRHARAAVTAEGATAETVLWEVWQRSGLGPRWQAASAAGGARGAAADRDLDAVMALFDDVARFVDRLPRAGPEVFLDHVAGQQIPGDSLAPRAPDDDAVRLLTAHAAKGLEWHLVVVAGVQEGSWPDLRTRGSVLGSERLAELVASGVDVPGSALWRALEEERRLFYVAVTRARERLVVTAVDDGEEGEQPSRFLADVPLGADDAARLADVSAGRDGAGRDGAGRDRAGREGAATLGDLRRGLPLPLLLPRLQQLGADPDQPAATLRRATELAGELADLTRSLDLSSLVAELRAVVTDGAADVGLRRSAAAALARLAAADVPGADPGEWYAVRSLSDDRPLHDDGATVPVSPSRVESFTRCRLRWLLESLGARGPDSAAQSVGTLVHALAAATAGVDLRDPAAVEDLLADLERRWAAVDLGSPWYGAQQRRRAELMLRRFVAWATRPGARELVGTELDFAVDVPAGPVTGRVTGRVDRLERDAAGRGVVVDLKTGGTPVRGPELVGHAQLGVYQVAVERSAFPDARFPAAGGAALLQLGKAAGTTAAAKEQHQPALGDTDDPGWAHRLVVEAARGMAGAAFPAQENPTCDRCPVRSCCPLQDDGRQVVAP